MSINTFNKTEGTLIPVSTGGRVKIAYGTTAINGSVVIRYSSAGFTTKPIITATVVSGTKIAYANQYLIYVDLDSTTTQTATLKGVWGTANGYTTGPLKETINWIAVGT